MGFATWQSRCGKEVLRLKMIVRNCTTMSVQ